MIREETKDVLINLRKTLVDNVASELDINEIEAIDTVIEALEQEPCEDAISLDTVIEWLKTKDIIKLSSQEKMAREELKVLQFVREESQERSDKE